MNFQPIMTSLFCLFLLGYYTRSGYVPGPVCKYNWTKVWTVADSNSHLLASKVSKVNVGHWSSG